MDGFSSTGYFKVGIYSVLRKETEAEGMRPKTEENKQRNTLILAAVILGIALLLCVPRLIAGSRVPENTLEVVVAVDGEEAAAFPLSGKEDVIIDGYRGGFNHLVIRDGEAVLTEADCPDRRCTRMGPISEPGEWMVCLPHRVTVTIR